MMRGNKIRDARSLASIKYTMLSCVPLGLALQVQACSLKQLQFWWRSPQMQGAPVKRTRVTESWWRQVLTCRVASQAPGSRPETQFQFCLLWAGCSQSPPIISSVQSFLGGYCGIIQNVPKWPRDPKSNSELWGHGDLIANYLQNLIGVINKLSM